MGKRHRKTLRTLDLRKQPSERQIDFRARKAAEIEALNQEITRVVSR